MAEDRPPFVKFEIRTEEDRQATIEAGHYVGNDVIFAIVTPTGSRDQVERKVEDWLANLAEGVKQERIPAEWLYAYTKAFENFKESRETPTFGAPIKDWPSASPAQIKTLLDINVTTVEELAVANEETVGRIGMGGRALKQKAIIWLEEAQNQGQSAEKIAELLTQNEQLKADNESMTARLTALEAQMKAQPKETVKA